MPTVTFLEPGTDATEDLTFFANTFTSNGTVASVSDQAHVGSRSLKSTVSVQGGYATAFATQLFIASDGVISFWVRFSTATPAVNTLFFITCTDADSQASLGLGLDTTGVLRICGRSCTSVAGSTTLSANTWYRLTLSHQWTSSTDWDLKLYLNGVLEASTGDAQGSQAFGTIQAAEIGINDFGPGGGGFDGSGLWNDSAAMSIWFDSIYCDDRSDLTDPGTTDGLDVTAKRPFSNGSLNEFTGQIGSGGSGYGSGHTPQVNERPLDTANGWGLGSGGATKTEEYTIEGIATGDANPTGGTLLGVRGWIYASTFPSDTSKIIVDGTATNISTTSTPTLFTQNSATPTAYPAGAGTDIGMQTGSSVSTMNLYECGILVAYIPSGAPPVVGAKIIFRNRDYV